MHDIERILRLNERRTEAQHVRAVMLPGVSRRCLIVAHGGPNSCNLVRGDSRPDPCPIDDDSRVGFAARHRFCDAGCGVWPERGPARWPRRGGGKGCSSAFLLRGTGGDIAAPVSLCGMQGEIRHDVDKLWRPSSLAITKEALDKSHGIPSNSAFSPRVGGGGSSAVVLEARSLATLGMTICNIEGCSAEP